MQKGGGRGQEGARVQVAGMIGGKLKGTSEGGAKDELWVSGLSPWVGPFLSGGWGGVDNAFAAPRSVSGGWPGAQRPQRGPRHTRFSLLHPGEDGPEGLPGGRVRRT